jgi:hypothetical protein
MIFSASECLRGIEIAIGFAVTLQTIEFFMMRRAFSERGIWRWSLLQNEFPAPLRQILTPVLSDQGFLLVLMFRLFTAILLMVKAYWLFSLILTFTTLLVSLRWLGTFNGGSDYMTFLILYSITTARYFQNHERVLKGALLFIAIQTCLSYFVAGVVKLKRADWRSGFALRAFITSSNYEVPERVRRLTSRPRLFMMMSWILIIFECGFPLALHDPRTAVFFITAAALFHLGAFYLFGLNRFFFAWLAAYPALFYWSQAGFSNP